MGKYEEALERAKSFIERGGEYDRQVMEYIFPELKESEDERIRNLIYCLIRDRSDNQKLLEYNGVSVDKALAYLEKQKPAEWSEDYREEDIQTRFAFYTYKDDPSVLYLSNVFVEETSRNHGFGTRILKAAEKAAEAIGAITICLKVKQDSPANAWYRKNGYGYVAFEDGYDWLEKNLEYLKPAKSAEWSEEFLRLMGITISQDGNQVCVLLGENLAEGIAGFGDTLADAVEEFKKEWRQFDRFRKATWKPSEEQMEALMLAIEGKWDAIKPTGYMSRRLEDLYEGLANTFGVECNLEK